MADSPKYKMKISLHVLKHLGLNLYSNMSAVLSEVVANSYDADADEVSISIDFDSPSIIITDDGHGMSLKEINDKYLLVGYSRRENFGAFSPKYNRPVMGRKGIGKLSLFSIANTVEIHTTKDGNKNGLILNSRLIEDAINSDSEYHPEEVPLEKLSIQKGTKIILTDFKRKINYTESRLRKRIARRFSVIGDEHNFNVIINEKPVSVEDRDYFKTIQFLWFIGDLQGISGLKYTFDKIGTLNGEIDDEEGYKVSGWIGTVRRPSDLTQAGISNNKISIICRGKMAQEDILASYTEGGIYADYLIGEIRADFLDSDDKLDISTSSRQTINEEDRRYQLLTEHVYKLLKQIQTQWTQLRNEMSEKDVLKKAEAVSPKLVQWFDRLRTPASKEHARKFFATIENFHFDDGEEKEKKRELYKQGIIAFEKLRLRENLSDLSKITTADDIKIAAIFADLSDIEANLYYDIASERVEVIRQFQNKLDANDKEDLLQTYIFDNLWLLNPSWERPTNGSVVMEKRVETIFNKVINTLTPEERKGRLDIKYRTAAGKHIIIELKRYRTTYTINPHDLARQVGKYRSALEKALRESGEDHPNIETIIILGEEIKNIEPQRVKKILESEDATIFHYDTLIEQSLKSYSEYLDEQDKVGEIRDIIDSI